MAAGEEWTWTQLWPCHLKFYTFVLPFSGLGQESPTLEHCSAFVISWPGHYFMTRRILLLFWQKIEEIIKHLSWIILRRVWTLSLSLRNRRSWGSRYPLFKERLVKYCSGIFFTNFYDLITYLQGSLFNQYSLKGMTVWEKDFIAGDEWKHHRNVLQGKHLKSRKWH